MTNLEEELIARQRALLSTARSYKASASAREATLTKLGIAAPASAPITPADATSIPMNSSAVSSVVAVAGVALLVVASIVAVGRERPQSREAPGPDATTQQAKPPSSWTAPAPPPASGTSVRAGDSAAGTEQAPSTSARNLGANDQAAQEGSMADEIAMIDAASALVRAGNHGAALRAIQAYRKRFPSGRFAPEALALEIEALHASGKVDAARALAEQFIASSPESPIANRISKLVGLSDDAPPKRGDLYDP